MFGLKCVLMLSRKLEIKTGLTKKRQPFQTASFLRNYKLEIFNSYECAYYFLYFILVLLLGI